MSDIKTINIAGGVLEVKYDPISRQWFSEFKFPFGLTLRGNDFSPIGASGYNFSSSPVFDSAGNRIGIEFNGKTYTTFDEVRAIEEFTKAIFDNTIRNAVIDLANEIEAERRGQTTAPPPPPTPTIDNTTTPPPDPAGNNTLQGAANDDSGSSNPSTEENVGPASEDVSINAPPDPESARETPGDDNTKGTPPYENETFYKLKIDSGSLPGKRLKNPLSMMASYNYQLSLYMLTPDAYDLFLSSGRRDINVFNEAVSTSQAARDNNRKGGAFLLAQSGGAGPDPRAPGVKYDYYMDNLSFTHLSSTDAAAAPTNSISFKFQVIEPYGFSFVSNIKRAQKIFDEFSQGSSWGTKEKKIISIPFAKQFFILGIRFFGWDEQGRPVTGKETFEGAELDPNSSGTGALFETFYELTVYNLKYKIDGKATVYNLEGLVTSAALGANVKKGIVNTPVNISGSTVRDVLSGPNGILTKLNKDQQLLKKNGTITFPITYKVVWFSEESERIAFASMASDSRKDKSNRPGSRAEDTTDVNAELETKSFTDTNVEEIAVDSGKPIIQIIDDLIVRSNYVNDAVSFNYTDALGFDPETNERPIEDTPKAPLRWYRITPYIDNINWDPLTNDWAYDITYIFETYLIPVIDSPFAATTDTYYGPHKRYDYWYTGENVEILSYIQELNNQYINEVPAGNPGEKVTDNSEGNAQQVSSVPNTVRNIDLSTAKGGLDTAAAGSIRNVLYDPGSYTNATIQILGDPDFLMQENGIGKEALSEAYARLSYNRHYDIEKPFTIRPSGGQVFIEIDFKEPIDYAATGVSEVNEDGEGVTGVGGTLSINDSILFWDYPEGAKDVIKGISYRLLKVVSSFKNGLFTQTLEATINDFGRGAQANEAGREGGPSQGLSDEDVRKIGIAEEKVAVGTSPDSTPGLGKTATPQPKPTTDEPNS